MFVGIKAAKKRLASAAAAALRQNQGVHPEEIWKETLWALGPDGYWRSEISDQPAQLLSYASILADCPIAPFIADSISVECHSSAQMTVSIQSKSRSDPLTLLRASEAALTSALGDSLAARIIQERNAGKLDFKLQGEFPIRRIDGVHLEDVLHHPELFENYPHLKRISVTPFRGESRPGCLMVYPESLSIPSLLHDVQHLIQDIEGFERPIALRDAHRVIAFLQDQAASAVEALDELVKRRSFLLEEVARSMTEFERRAAGEHPLVQQMCAEIASTGDGGATMAEIAEIVSLVPRTDGAASTAGALLAENLSLLETSIEEATLHANETFVEYTDMCRLGPAKIFYLSYGEAEARNTGTRAPLTLEMRLALPPSLTCSTDASAIKSLPKGFASWASQEDQANDSPPAHRLH